MVHRLFVALTPPEPVRDALVDMMEALDHARWVDEENLHLTLRFVGEVERRGADDLAAALSRVRFVPFAVTLASVGHFARRGVVHALHARVLPTPPLLALRTQVERAAIAAGQPARNARLCPPRHAGAGGRSARHPLQRRFGRLDGAAQ